MTTASGQRLLVGGKLQAKQSQIGLPMLFPLVFSAVWRDQRIPMETKRSPRHMTVLEGLRLDG